MTPLILVLYGVLALVVVDVYSGALLIVCAGALIYRRNRRAQYQRMRGGRWVDYVLIFLIARSVLLLIFGWMVGH
jgi:hypothetical protein